MNSCPEIFRSVEVIWLLWGASFGLLLWLGRRTLTGMRGCDWQRLLRDERGAAYSVSYVMTFPLYALLICLVIETTLLIVVKIGTVYAGYGAARAAAVWQSAEPTGREQDKARTAAVHAMVPFASGSPHHQPSTRLLQRDEDRLRAYLSAYRVHASNGGARDGYLTRKYRYADAATRVRLDWPGPDVVATVTYTAPLHVPGIGRLFGLKRNTGDGFYEHPIETQVKLESHSPPAASGPSGRPGIGIQYRSE